METIFWTQNADINEMNSVYIDGKSSREFSKSEVDAAFQKITQFQLDEDFAYVDFQNVCTKFNLPKNFKFFVDSKRGSLLQATFVERDNYGRPMPFMIWTKSANPKYTIRELITYAAICGKTLDKSNLKCYLKAWKHMNKGATFVGAGIVVLIAILIILIISWLIWNLQN